MSNRKTFFRLSSRNNYVGNQANFEYVIIFEGYSTSGFLRVDIEIRGKHLIQLYDVTGQVDALQKAYQISRDLNLTVTDFVLNLKDEV